MLTGSDDWSWRVRYSAIHGLVKVCRCCVGDQTKEGVRTVAWNALLKANSLEKDLRVLEALKVGQVSTILTYLYISDLERSHENGEFSFMETFVCYRLM